jgi:hypothetical protein
MYRLKTRLNAASDGLGRGEHDQVIFRDRDHLPGTSGRSKPDPRSTTWNCAWSEVKLNPQGAESSVRQ